MAELNALSSRLSRWLLDPEADDEPLRATLLAEPPAMVVAAQALDSLDALLGGSGDLDEAVERLEGLIDDALLALAAGDRAERVALIFAAGVGPTAAGLLTPYASAGGHAISASGDAWPERATTPIDAMTEALGGVVTRAHLPRALAALDDLDRLIAEAAVDESARAAAEARWLDPLEGAVERGLLELDPGARAGLRPAGPRGAALLGRALLIEPATAARDDAPRVATASQPASPLEPVVPSGPERAAAPTATVLRLPMRRTARVALVALALAAAAALALFILRPTTPDEAPLIGEGIGPRPVGPGPDRVEPTPAIGPTSATAYRPALRAIPAATVQLGSPADEPGRQPDETRRPVTLSRPYLMARTEVTQAQWSALMGTAPARFQGDYGGGPTHPVERVSWYGAVAYANALSIAEGHPACYTLRDCAGEPGDGAYACRAVDFSGLDCGGYRLPTEAEWEHAARAGTTAATYAGPFVLRDVRDAPVLEAIAWYSGNSAVERGGFDCREWEGRPRPATRCGTHPVAGKQANPWGLHDMIGNVWEWTHDWHGPLESAPATDPLGAPTGHRKVTKGCGWYRDARFCRAANRYRPKPGYRSSVIGFRPVRTLR